MLILARKEGESITIGDDVTITVVSIHRNMVRLGFNGPKQTKILREELLTRERQEVPT